MKKQKQEKKVLTAAEYREQAEKHKAALKGQWKTFLKSGVFTLAAVAALAISSVAWFANNKQVAANNNAVQSQSSEVSIYIDAGNLVGKKAQFTFSDSVDATQFSGNLYPISTADLETWYYAATWNGPLVKTYGDAALSQDSDHADRWNYMFKDKEYTAYNLANYTIYTSEGGTLDVYFDPAGAITFDEGDGAKELLDSIRVGIAIDGTLKFVYAPVAESGRGNSANTTSNLYYCIGTVDAAPAVQQINDGSPYLLLESLSDYTAGTADDVYTAGTTKLFTANENGTLVSVYVWIEGTDAQAMIGHSDDAHNLTMSLSLVGVANA